MFLHFNVVILGIILEEDKSIMVGLSQVSQVIETYTSRYTSQKVMTYNFWLLILDLGVSQTIGKYGSFFHVFFGGAGKISRFDLRIFQNSLDSQPDLIHWS